MTKRFAVVLEVECNDCGVKKEFRAYSEISSIILAQRDGWNVSKYFSPVFCPTDWDNENMTKMVCLDCQGLGYLSDETGSDWLGRCHACNGVSVVERRSNEI